MTQKTTKIPRLPLTDDYIFKRVFAFEGNKSVLTNGKGQIMLAEKENKEIKRAMNTLNFMQEKC